MGLKVEPAYIGQSGYDHPVELDRNLLEGLFQRSGAVRFGDFAISQGVGTRAVAVAPGRYFLLGTENAQQGGYFVWSDAVETSLLGAAVGNPRIDSFILRVHDDQYGSIPGSPQAKIDVVQGVAAGSPTARPDSDFNVGGSFYVPGAWVRLGDVRVNTADTGSIPPGQITTANRHIRPPGGYCLCTSTTRPSDPVYGDKIHETDTHLRYWYDGAAWKGMPTGIIARHRRTTSSTGTTSEVGVVRLDGIPLKAGRRYRVSTNKLGFNSTVTGDTMVARLRMNTAGNATTSSGIMVGGEAQFEEVDSAWHGSDEVVAYYNPSSDVTASILLTAGRVSGTGTVTILANGSETVIELIVEDLGDDPGSTGVNI